MNSSEHLSSLAVNNSFKLLSKNTEPEKMLISGTEKTRTNLTQNSQPARFQILTKQGNLLEDNAKVRFLHTLKFGIKIILVVQAIPTIIAHH